MKAKQVEGFDIRLQQAIYNKGVTNRQVALQIGIPWSCMNGYINEGKMPCCLYLVKLAKLLNVTTDWLLGLEDTVNENKRM